MIVLILVMQCIAKSQTFVLDINSPEISDSIEMYEGTFSEGGIYRMYYATTEHFYFIKCNDFEFNLPRFQKMPKEIYIQDFLRGKYRHVVISAKSTTGRKKITNHYFQGDDILFTKGNRKRMLKFIGEITKLSVHAQSNKIHPFIKKLYIAGKANMIIWRVIPINHDPQANLVKRLRHTGGNVTISPFLGIEYTANNDPSHESYISSHAKEIQQMVDTNKIILILNWNVKYYIPQAICIPQVQNNIFKPKNILYCSDSPPLKVFNKTLGESKAIQIDVSCNHAAMPEIIFLANLQRGCWYYSQYTIADLGNSQFKKVNVADSKRDYIIYSSDNNEIVTHVEIFEHIIYGWKYVVVNKVFVDLSNEMVEFKDENHKVYKCIHDGDNVRYYDLDAFWVDPYISMLHNINTAKECYQDVHDYLLS
ncbi:uncharacterized protein BBOV_IV008420 [Babesia bovis T2Bo]|uniref:Uncharacterized protein n=1 Tax=Babesia bovis TaxID=5865 RepID=A7ARM7_BABBO|nr:uncharacterized protein BBOV_IV008420 [Babesia bovis T2Bo]EDO07196.1 hypothetical protein BBOV_IV008420 [Babesia bovis T2Bo]|eukprot:XP_001610764.1 hypothetical protein [Babesia bovis T2Bo]